MTKEQALDKAMILLSSEGTIESGRRLLKLKRHISKDKFDDLRSAFYASTPLDIIIKLERHS